MQQADLESDRWDPLTPDEVARTFGTFDAPWWIAGGWAIELFVGAQIRPHDEIDVEIPRADASRLSVILDGWDRRLAASGRLTPWSPTAPIPTGTNSIWCRPSCASLWHIQVLFADVEDGIWRYRRDRNVSKPLEEIVRRTEDGTPFLAPEVQLLYKSVDTRPKDRTDRRTVWPLMNAAQRGWMRDALDRVQPGDRWIDTVI